MRVMFVPSPGIGHVFPMIPLAWALRAAGSEVLVATAGQALAARNAGLAVVDVAPDFDGARMFARMKREQPELVATMLSARVTDLREFAPRLAAVSSMLVDGVVDTALRWRPDVIIRSPIQGAGLVAAAKLGIPSVDHGSGFVRSIGLAEELFRNMTEVFDRHGVDDLPERRVSIDVAPPSMLGGPVPGWSMRYVPYNGGGVLPPWLFADRGGRRLIAVTLGTVAPGMSGLGPVERIIAAAPEVDADFVVALGDVDTSGLGELPPNVRVAGWIPLNALLRVSSALVHHGGAGSTLGALVAGLPQLVLPSGADRHVNADAVRDAGAGLSATEDELDADLIARTLADDGLRRRAGEISAEIRALPSPAEIAGRLADFVHEGHGD
ncbi:MAG: DUF1205 domain-containing protein [Kutzneria sp.]|nr:DUF1205 domain-containing protein [Kutzneria sp.]